MLNIIVTLKCGLEVTQGHSKWYHLKAWDGFLFAFHSNYGRIFSHFGLPLYPHLTTSEM